MTIEEIRKAILPILKPYQVTRAGIFGSVVRGETSDDSDIDILVDIKKNISLLEFVKLKMQLEKKLGKKVDLIEYQTLKPALRDKILQEQISVL